MKQSESVTAVNGWEVVLNLTLATVVTAEVVISSSPLADGGPGLRGRPERFMVDAVIQVGKSAASLQPGREFLSPVSSVCHTGAFELSSSNVMGNLPNELCGGSN